MVPERRSTEAAGALVDERGFMAALSTIGSPLLIPPSSPPAKLEPRTSLPGEPRIGSWPRLPDSAASSNPGPISTPLIAGIEQMA